MKIALPGTAPSRFAPKPRYIPGRLGKPPILVRGQPGELDFGPVTPPFLEEEDWCVSVLLCC